MEQARLGPSEAISDFAGFDRCKNARSPGQSSSADAPVFVRLLLPRWPRLSDRISLTSTKIPLTLNSCAARNCFLWPLLCPSRLARHPFLRPRFPRASSTVAWGTNTHTHTRTYLPATRGCEKDHQPPASLLVGRIRRHQQAERVEHGLRAQHAGGVQVPRDGVQDRGHPALHEGGSGSRR